ncbi:DUF4832 domain-containing protein [Tautonia plasticadhaerens]|uniref:DUF4832 domain-containing protein n=1 Tax=Tautonia plasticadhaerens TaxID=2527974 RepID=A0A518HF84_9BACT|nr:DUF4832 domain-containing protein [Tautonia plasticadhaerens]QDV39502.1 hypothetical protein ElP_74700 [Tautonia plasticadhaerens]
MTHVDRLEVAMLRRDLNLGIILALGLSTGRSRARDATDWREIRYREGTRAMPNPERGFYAPRMSDRMDRLGGLRERGITLLLVEIDLKPFKDSDLTPAKLDEVRAAFDATRRHGLKAIVRAAYGFTGRDYRADPEDMGRILGHIRQLGETYREHRDVLYAVQAGFLGPWGEWHGSNWGDPPSLEARRAVLFGLLDVVPDPICVQVRRPMFIRDIFADEPGGSELADAAAHGGTRLSRTGWHNDALLSPPTDMGTYAQPGWDRDRELRWCDSHGRHTPFGGETVPSSSGTPIDRVVEELGLLHACYLNSAYHRGTLDGWREAEYRGGSGFEHIERRLGYRLVAERLRHSTIAEPGGELRVELELRNVGFASPHLPREVALILDRGDRAYRLVLEDVDPRRWDPEVGTVTLRGEVPISADAPPGKWRLGLHLADPSPRLRDDGRYAIRLAGEGIGFEESAGWNVLADDLEIR